MDYIFDKIDAKLIKELAKLDDEALKIGVYVMICEITRGARVPNKRHKIKLAKALINQGLNFKKVREFCQISKAQYYKLIKEKDA
ncbi:hypothetical protein [Campylobacter majalis]|uniref:hypothetical protein n=1 Tax=Campylobacter majalis TaxID=2790656 RepID=UPI003D686B7E